MNRENKYDHMILRAEDKAINWYPGHMARAKRKLEDQLSRVDVVVELCDARIPRASRNPELDKLVRNKKRLLISTRPIWLRRRRPAHGSAISVRRAWTA